MRWSASSVLVLFVLFSGCLIGGNGATTAEQLAGVRDAYMNEGQLTPDSMNVREQYRNEILPFRSTINQVGGNDGAALKAYLNGSLSLLHMADSTENAMELLQNVNLDAPECGTNSPMSRAIGLLNDARADAESAYDDFTSVQENVSIANALGADYVLNAFETTSAVVLAHGERIKELKTACGFSV